MQQPVHAVFEQQWISSQHVSFICGRVVHTGVQKLFLYCHPHLGLGSTGYCFNQQSLQKSFTAPCHRVSPWTIRSLLAAGTAHSYSFQLKGILSSQMGFALSTIDPCLLWAAFFREPSLYIYHTRSTRFTDWSCIAAAINALTPNFFLVLMLGDARSSSEFL